MKNTNPEQKVLTDGILADLFWKLRLQMESHNGTTLDIHRLRKDIAYRESALIQAVSSGNRELNALAAAIRQRFAQLSNNSFHSDHDSTPKSRFGAPAVAGAAVVVMLLVITGFFLFQSKPETPPAASLAAASAQARSTDSKAAPAAAPRTLFRIHGSNTVGEKLAPALAKEYLGSLGATDIAVLATDTGVENYVTANLKGEPVQIEMHAHGSTTAFVDLAAGSTDIGMSSRRIKSEEVEELKPTLGDLSKLNAEHILALDGLAVIVHPALPFDELDTGTIARLFAGEIANWQEVGGPDLKVQVLARDDNSGTWDSFLSMVLKPQGKELAASARRYESSQELSDSVAASEGAIGFIGLPYVRQAKLVAVSDSDDALAVLPNSFTVSTEDYPLARRLYLYLPSRAANLEARRFVEFALAQTGQQVVNSVGLVSQNITTSKQVPLPDMPPRYAEVTGEAERLSLNFRFEFGSDSIDNKGQRDIQRLVNYLLDNPGRRVMLLGFTDSVGNPATNLELSQTRAELVNREFMKFGVFPSLVAGFGDAVPVASNDTEEGRNRNRRVEVWVI